MTGEPLDVWIHGTHTAILREDSSGRLQWAWTDSAQDRWGNARILSAKLTTGQPVVPPLVKAYLDGLLPEGNARTNYAIDAGVGPDDTFRLIGVYGRDAPGAAIFVPSGAGDPTGTGRYTRIGTGDVVERLHGADQHQPSRTDGRLDSSTLPGMVPKIALHRDADGTWMSCSDGAPSTWILKRGLAGEASDVIDTEAACLDLAKRVGITTIDAEVVEFGDTRAIAVSRYDRNENGDGSVERSHQEDLAQALGLATTDPNRKFQWGGRMPSLAAGAKTLLLDGGNPDDLLRLATFSHIVGNTDMHAKNISFIRHADGRVALSPAYDIAMHLHHGRDNRRVALDVNGKFLIAEISSADLVAEGESWGLSPQRVRRVVETMARDVQGALFELDPADHPGVSQQAWDVVQERSAATVRALPPRRRVHGGRTSAARGKTTPASTGGSFKSRENPEADPHIDLDG